MHHGNNFPEDPRIKSFFEQTPKIRTFTNELGPTGKFPEGKLNNNDEGEIMCSIGESNGKVIMNFGKKPIAWIGFSKQQAYEIADSLMKYANKLN